MKYMKHIYKVRAKLLIMMSAVLLLTAFSDDTDRLSDEEGVLQIAAYTKDMATPSWPAATRAISIPSDYSQYTGSASIGVFLTPTTTEMTLIYYEDSVWHSMAKVSTGTQYYIYGYMPAYATCQISQNVNFENGAVLTFNNIPSVMSEDFSVITGIMQLESDSTGIPIEEGTLKSGTFSYTGKGNGRNFVTLMFDHLYGALSISLKVDLDYNALRTIKLKELKLRNRVENTPAKSHTNVTVTLTKTEGTNPISSIVFTPTGDDVGDISFFQSATGEELVTSYKTFTGHFMPEGITTFVLTSVYDVYDKKGNLIRKDCTANNTLEISKLFDRQDMTKRGWKYNVNMTIMPTFLYMLSEPDLNNPTVAVN